MSLETLTFADELDELKACKKQLEQNELTLRDRILSSDFLINDTEFHRCLSSFQDNIVALVETVEKPVVGLPETQAIVNPEEPEREKHTLGYPQAGLLAVGVIASMILALYALIPPMMVVYVLGFFGILAFGPQIWGALLALFRKPEEEKKSRLLEDWVIENLTKIRDTYTATRFLIKIQDQDKDDLPNNELIGMDEALYVRKQQSAELLPSDFLDMIGEIMVSCDKNFWARRSVIMNAICVSRQSAVKGA